MFGGSSKAVPELPQLERSQLRKLLRIVFIDDERSHKAEALRNQGYNVFERTDVTDLREFENNEWHLVFCDIRGVGKHLSESEGAGLIKLIKAQIKYPYVVAYSGYAYQPGDPQEIAMRENADAVIRKDAALDEYITLVDKLGAQAFSIERCVDLLCELTGKPRSEIVKMFSKPSTLAKALERLKTLNAITTPIRTVATIGHLVMLLAGA